MFNDATILPAPCAFLAPLRIALSPDYPGLILAEQRFDIPAYTPALFYQLGLQQPHWLTRAVPKRQAEYLASRYAARVLLEHSGISGFQVINDVDRVPLWPQGIRGSVSHSHQRAVIALSSSEYGWQPGIDCEQLMNAASAENLQDAIITPTEQALLAGSTLSFASALTLAFSMKESLYKALFPQFRQVMGFDSATLVSLNNNGTHAVLEVVQEVKGGIAPGSRYDAHAWFTPGEVMILVVRLHQ